MRNPVYKIIQITFLGALMWSGLAGMPAAAGKHTQEAVQWLSKAVRAYDREDYGAAKTNLEMALQTEPDFSEAYLLKGLLEYHDGQLEKANASWKRAMDLNPRLPEQMRKELEKQAHAVESTMTVQDFSHFHLQFNGAEKREEAWRAVKILDEAYNEMGSTFGVFPETRFPVVIFTNEEFWEAWHAPIWLGGFFDNRDGRIRVRIDTPQGGDAEYRRRVRHEFTHAYLHTLLPRELPVWFNEGTAQFYAYAIPGNGLWKDNRLEELRKLMKGAPWMDMARIDHVIRKKDASPGAIYLAYLESEALVLQIAKDRGDSWIPSLMERLKAGASFDGGFQEVVGVPAAQMLERTQHGLQ